MFRTMLFVAFWVLGITVAEGQDNGPDPSGNPATFPVERSDTGNLYGASTLEGLVRATGIKFSAPDVKAENIVCMAVINPAPVDPVTGNTAINGPKTLDELVVSAGIDASTLGAKLGTDSNAQAISAAFNMVFCPVHRQFETKAGPRGYLRMATIGPNVSMEIGAALRSRALRIANTTAPNVPFRAGSGLRSESLPKQEFNKP